MPGVNGLGSGRPTQGPKGLRFVSRKPATGLNVLTVPQATITLSGLVPAFTQGIIYGTKGRGPPGLRFVSPRFRAAGQTTMVAPLGTLNLNGNAAGFVQSFSANLRYKEPPRGFRFVSKKAYNIGSVIPVTMTAPIGSLNLNGLTTQITQGNQFIPPTGTLNLNGLVANFAQGSIFTAPTSNLILTGLVPLFLQGNTMFQAQPGQLTFLGSSVTFLANAQNVFKYTIHVPAYIRSILVLR